MKKKKKEERKRMPGEIIPLCYDKLFKKVFADVDHVERLEALVSIGLGVPMEDVKGRVSLLNSERVVYDKKQKKQILDVVAEIKYPNKRTTRIDIEVNLDEASTLLKGIAYGSGVFGSGLKVSEDYSDIPGMIQLAFDKYEINKNNPRIVKEYYLKDETNTILFEALKFKHINIEKSQEAWYNNTIQKERIEDQNLIRFGAAMSMDKKDLFLACMESVVMDEDIKKDIEDAVIEYSEDANAWLYFDIEKDKKASENARLSFAKAKGKAEGIELGIEQRNIEVVKSLLSQNVSIEIIKNATGFTEAEIEEIKKEIVGL